MIDFLGPPKLYPVPLSPVELEPRDDEIVRSRPWSDLSDWVFVVATALFVVDVILCWSH